MIRRALAFAAVAATGTALLIPAGSGAAITGLVGFMSPSRNIGCYMDTSQVRCDARSHTWQFARPRNCPSFTDYGQGLFVTRRSSRGGVVCAGDTALGGKLILRYGHSISRGTIRCSSARAGITCRNAKGHGFFIARSTYRLF
jgi:hypothetical protein